MAPRFTARLPAGHLSAPLPAGHPSARLPARPPDPLCGLGYSPSDPRQSDAEGKVCRHAERLLNMVHAYCEIRDSWTGWLRGSAMSRTLHERIVPEMRALRDAERRIVGPTLRDPARRARLRRPRAAGGAGVHTSRHDRSSAAARAGHGARGVRADDRRGREGGPCCAAGRVHASMPRAWPTRSSASARRKPGACVP